MKPFSSTNTFSTSDGERFTRAQIEAKIRRAKKAALLIQQLEYGYNFCIECRRNDCVPLDCAHVVPVKDCLEGGYAELAWDVKNIEILGRKCHEKYDKNNVQSKTK